MSRSRGPTRDLASVHATSTKGIDRIGPYIAGPTYLDLVNAYNSLCIREKMLMDPLLLLMIMHAQRVVSLQKCSSIVQDE